MASEQILHIEVCYALPEQQISLQLTVNYPCSVKQALEQSGILTNYPEINLANHKVGIFSKQVQLEQLINDGDRIEIYRPLQIDPKQARRLKAQKKIISERK